MFCVFRAINMEAALPMACTLCSSEICFHPPPPWGVQSFYILQWLRESIQWLLSWQPFLLLLPSSIQSFFFSSLNLAVHLEHSYASVAVHLEHSYAHGVLHQARFRQRCRAFYKHHLFPLTGFLLLFCEHRQQHSGDESDGFLHGTDTCCRCPLQSSGSSSFCGGRSASDTLELLLELL
ncbi:E4 ORFE [Murine adenovirus 3]|uniref:E4 ORFE n=1 Tax=Murine adenovirus 3 TaxID=573199 RepID=C3SAV6_9ADEN|nr:E4 ORFE [Murine adenovirus 3]ACJ14526.1 E4 ORFE [Murine adenovirus 3]